MVTLSGAGRACCKLRCKRGRTPVCYKVHRTLSLSVVLLWVLVSVASPAVWVRRTVLRGRQGATNTCTPLHTEAVV